MAIGGFFDDVGDFVEAQIPYRQKGNAFSVEGHALDGAQGAEGGAVGGGVHPRAGVRGESGVVRAVAHEDGVAVFPLAEFFKEP